MPPRKANPLRRRELKRDFAKSLRANPTDAERKLWSLLRGRQLAAHRFRRQQPIGPYIVDFFCPPARLIVELDGGQHSANEAVTYDKSRTHFLNARGYRVLRFWNNDVLRDPHAVTETIWHALQKPKYVEPSP